MFSITECRTPKEKQLFENVAEILHGKEDAFIPPFPGSIAKFLSPKSAFNRRHGEIFPFIAWNEGKPVGRIAAIVNRSHNAYYKDTTGFFGFFECEDSQETAQFLFERAAQELKNRGLTTIRGPYNPSINDECGLLVDAFDRRPCIGMTWNPPYYEKLVLAEGLQTVCTLYGYTIMIEHLEPPARTARIVERLAKRSNLKLRPINIKKLETELEIVCEVYNCTLERNWGFFPITMDDLMGAADDIKAIADPDLLLIAEMNGENAGVALTLPDFNEVLAKVKNTPRWIRLLHILWAMKTHHIQGYRQTVLGVSPRFRDKGISAWLLHQQYVRARELGDHGILGWIESTNTEVLEVSELFGGVRDRTWKIYEKPLK